MKPLWFYPVCISLASNCGGLKAQLLCIAQGSALGGRLGIAKSVELCKSSLLYEGQRPVALRVTRSRRVAFLRRRHKNAECINRGVRFPQGVALGCGQLLGLQPASINTFACYLPPNSFLSGRT